LSHVQGDTGHVPILGAKKAFDSRGKQWTAIKYPFVTGVGIILIA